MEPKFFWRRVLATLIDLTLISVLCAVVIVALNPLYSGRLLAPEIIQSTVCQQRDDLVTAERMNALLPLEEGQVHAQQLCRVTNTFLTSYYVARLQKVGMTENGRSAYTLHYTTNAAGESQEYIFVGGYFYFFAPFLLAFALWKWGTTPGKRLVRLYVMDDQGVKPTPVAALKREYFKAIFCIIFSLLPLIFTVVANNWTDDDAASFLQSFETEGRESAAAKILMVYVVLSVAALIFTFGSFVVWRGRTFWDRFAGLVTRRKTA
ncbi:RDD family protein [Yoonia sp. BS5-3]|uniref:RDD family protein n=1 Tax=Yoonia phaeophyticola TaxID=3137369 RepID=A0ABZ2V4H4_9RHOB